MKNIDNFTRDELSLLLNSVRTHRMYIMPFYLKACKNPGFYADIEYQKDLLDSIGNLEGKLSHLLSKAKSNIKE